MKFLDLKYKARITPLTRLTKYIDILDKNVAIDDKVDQHKIEFLMAEAKRAIITLRVFSYVRLFFYILLYASIISGFGQLLLFEELTNQILGVSAIIGTTFSAGMVLMLNAFVNMYFEHVRTITSHMIAIYTKHDNNPLPALEQYIKDLI